MPAEQARLCAVPCCAALAADTHGRQHPPSHDTFPSPELTTNGTPHCAAVAPWCRAEDLDTCQLQANPSQRRCQPAICLRRLQCRQYVCLGVGCRVEHSSHQQHACMIQRCEGRRAGYVEAQNRLGG